MNPLRPAKSPQEKWAARALAVLAERDPDGARMLNGVGFNAQDGGIGHSLASMLSRRGALTEKQWVAAIKVCRKYHRQVGACPPDVEAEKETREQDAGERSSREREQAGRPVTAPARRLSCGCCTEGCICQTHADASRGVPPATCSLHGGR